MTLKIYGNMNSSTFRVVWAVEELDLMYELIQIETDNCLSDDKLAHLNPNKKIPVIDDNGFIMWESMAINLYLARNNPSSLSPCDEIEDAQMQMWSFWVSNECLSDCFTVLSHTILLPDAERSVDAIQGAMNRLYNPLTVLNKHLGKSSFVVGERFTIADINLASIIGWLNAARSDITNYSCLSNWLKQCANRPAARRCIEMMK